MSDWYAPHDRGILSRIASIVDLIDAAGLDRDAVEFLSSQLDPKLVKTTTLRKRGGGFRVVARPLNEDLRRLHSHLKEFLDREVFLPEASVQGFVRQRNTLSNASLHVGSTAVLTVDLVNFFESIDRPMILTGLVRYHATAAVADSIANACTLNAHLPAGFATSPVLSNIVFESTDVKLQEYADSAGLNYSRYADDLTFSGQAIDDSVLASVRTIIQGSGFRLNDKKTHFQRRGHHQVVTGLSVADHLQPRVPRHFKKRLRRDIYFVAKYGLAAQADLRETDIDSFVARVSGQINYVLGIERDLGHRLQKAWLDAIEKDSNIHGQNAN